MRETVEMLPLSCWPLWAVMELRESIAAAVAAGRVQGRDALTVSEWARRVDDELAARAGFDLEAAMKGTV